MDIANTEGKIKGIFTKYKSIAKMDISTKGMEIHKMTPFSSALEFYMKEKDIKTYSIAQYCGIERSNMYKLINGKRNPGSEEQVGKIAEYMKLTPRERDYLLETYQITVMGYDAYYRRKSVEDFLLSFANRFPDKEKRQSQRDYATIKVDEDELKMRQGKLVKGRELRNLAVSILNLEMQKEKGQICFLMQPDEQWIGELLSAATGMEKRLCIEHILCLSNTNDITPGKRNYNLRCLKKMFPLFVQSGFDYHPYCYYDHAVFPHNRFSLFSSMLLTSEYAIIYSMEEKYGMLLSEDDMIEHLHGLFRSMKEDASVMAIKLNSFEKQLESFEKINIHSKGVSFQPEACLIPVMPTEFLDKYVNKSLLVDPQIRERLILYLQSVKQSLELPHITFLFTETGIRRFAEKGRLLELPDEIYHPLEVNDRKVLIRRLMIECEKGKYQMIRSDAPIAGINICVFSTAQSGYLLFSSMKGERVYLELRESGLLEAFREYFENLDKKYLYSTDETVKKLKELIQKKSF